MMTDASLIFIELGAVVIGLAILARLASRWRLSAVPLYLLAGLAFGNGGLLPLQFSEGFVEIGAEIGVILLMFMLGLEYTADDLRANLKAGIWDGLVDAVLNFTPGLIAGLVLGWSPFAAALLGGVTYISSSGIAAQLLAGSGRMGRPETDSVVSILVLEDLAMALFLPLMAVLLIGGSAAEVALPLVAALLTVSLVLFAAARFGPALSRVVSHQSNEVILFTTLGAVLMVAGLAEKLRISAAIGAFLVGIALSGPLAARAHRELRPLRDLFAAIFFLFFGLQVDPSALVPMLGIAISLGALTALTKVLTGWLSARRRHLESGAGLRAGLALVARGEFSIVIAGIGVALQPELGALATAYVLTSAVLGPVLVRFADPVSDVLPPHSKNGSSHEKPDPP